MPRILPRVSIGAEFVIALAALIRAAPTATHSRLHSTPQIKHQPTTAVPCSKRVGSSRRQRLTRLLTSTHHLSTRVRPRNRPRARDAPRHYTVTAQAVHPLPVVPAHPQTSLRHTHAAGGLSQVAGGHDRRARTHSPPPFIDTIQREAAELAAKRNAKKGWGGRRAAPPRVTIRGWSSASPTLAHEGKKRIQGPRT